MLIVTIHLMESLLLWCLKNCFKWSSRKGHSETCTNTKLIQSGFHKLVTLHHLVRRGLQCTHLSQYTRCGCKLSVMLHNSILRSLTYGRIRKIHHGINLEKLKIFKTHKRERRSQLLPNIGSSSILGSLRACLHRDTWKN